MATPHARTGAHLLTLVLVALALLLGACSEQGDAPPPTRLVPTLLPTVLPAEAPTAAPAATTAEPARDTGWVAGSAGVELRTLAVDLGPDRAPAPIHVVRLDPSQVQLRVAYRPTAPLPLRAWFAESRPIVAVNAGYFAPDHRTVALLVSDGVASGESYQGFGGMLAVTPDGSARLQPLRDQPYDPAEPLAQALQSFPMLVFPGGTPADLDDDDRARRTAVAFDRSGRLLLLVAPTSALTLPELASWLATSDLDVDRALNLDGGSSTGMFVQAEPAVLTIDAFVPLPTVLLVERRPEAQRS